MKLTIREANGSSKVVELAKDLEIVAKKGQQFIFSNGFSSYSMNFKDDQKSVEFLFKIDGKSIKVSLNGIVPFLNENQADIENPTLVLINKDLNDQDIKSIIENNAFNGSEIIDKLESLIASKTNNTALVTDFQSLVETLEAAAAGGEGQGPARTSGVKVGSSDALSDSLFGLQETDRWINLERGISSLPVETGNTVASIAEAVLDTTATPAPTVVITEDANDDGLISKAELDGKVDVTITVPTEANVGDKLNVKNPDGTTTTVTITDEIKNSGYKTSYDAPAEDGTITVSATITDKAGNTSAEGSDTAKLDTTATPAPTVVITEDANNDGLISKAELDGKVDVTITVPTEANVGDTLNVKNPDGTTTTVEITADIKTNGYKTSYDAPAEGGTITVSATITDKAGNTSAEGKDCAILKLNVAPTISDIIVSVSEEGLANGIKDISGTSDTTDKVIITGTMSIIDENNDSITVTLIAPTTELKSNGQVIVWTLSNTEKELIVNVII